MTIFQLKLIRYVFTKLMQKTVGFIHHTPWLKGKQWKMVVNGWQMVGKYIMVCSKIRFVYQLQTFIGLVFFGTILTGNPWVFTIKLIGLSGWNCPIIQFYETVGKWWAPGLWISSRVWLGFIHLVETGWFRLGSCCWKKTENQWGYLYSYIYID